MPFPAALLVDDFGDRIVGSGWVINNAARYDPTHFDGLTPSGKAFTFDAVAAADGSITATLVIAGVTRTLTLTAAQGASWSGQATVTLLTNARAAFPASQR